MCDIFCKNCKYFRLYKSYKDEKQREKMKDFWADGVCKKYLPIESYYHLNHKTNMGNIGDEYRWICTNYETFTEEICKNHDMKKKIIDSVTRNFIPDDIYIHLYEMATNYIKTYVYDGYPKPGDIHRKFINDYGFEDFEKCVADNANFIVGNIFMHIKQSEHNGNILVSDFLKLLKSKCSVAVSYRDNNNMNINFSFCNRGIAPIVIDKKEKHIEIRSDCYSVSSASEKREYNIKVYVGQIKEINKGKADWKTGERRYTVTFKDKKNLFFDVRD